MNAGIKERWVAALRSGRYRQGKGQLRNGGLHCCLGVLCELHAAEGLGEWTLLGYRAVDKCSAQMPPPAVKEWAGFTDRIGWLAEANDEGSSFEQIAAVIERDL